MTYRLLEQAAIQSAGGVPDGFQFYRWECLGNFPNVIGYRMDGCVPTIKKSGKNKGKPNWRKPVEGTERTLYLASADYDKFKEAFAAAGGCLECENRRKILVRASVAEGSVYRDCEACKEGT